MENIASSAGVEYYLYTERESSRKIANYLAARNRCCKHTMECVRAFRHKKFNNTLF